jgi:hypothetical protein
MNKEEENLLKEFAKLRGETSDSAKILKDDTLIKKIRGAFRF